MVRVVHGEGKYGDDDGDGKGGVGEDGEDGDDVYELQTQVDRSTPVNSKLSKS